MPKSYDRCLELIIVVLVFIKISVNRSNHQFQALPHPRNSTGVSYNPTVVVMEIPGTMYGSHGHNTWHKSTIFLSFAATINVSRLLFLQWEYVIVKKKYRAKKPILPVLGFVPPLNH